MTEFKLDGLDHVALTVLDLERSIEWYQEVLGLERQHQEIWGDYPVFMSVGKTGLALFPTRAEKPMPTPDQRTTLAMRHVAFRSDWQNFAKAQEALRSRGIDFEFQDHQIARSIYFRDPDGNEIEITTYDLSKTD